MEMNIVESSNIHSVGWDPGGPTLRIVFHGKKDKPNSVYDYEGVTFEQFKEFMAAPSKGTHFAKAIRGRFLTRKIQ